MIGHIKVPALDDSGQPASLSPVVVTGLLRDRLGYQGVVVTDSLQMAGGCRATSRRRSWCRPSRPAVISC